jgi:hypothetical protein
VAQNTSEKHKDRSSLSQKTGVEDSSTGSSQAHPPTSTPNNHNVQKKLAQPISQHLQTPASSSSSTVTTQATGSVSTTSATVASSITTPLGTQASPAGTPVAPSTTSNSSRDLIKVCVRIRPPLLGRDDRNENNDNIVWRWDDHNIAPSVTAPIRKGATNSFSTINAEYFLAQQTQYSFDHVFAPEATTNEIFDITVRDIVSSAMTGMHGSVFMYGQTASGKTFTMNGVANQQGIIPQAVHTCFDSIELFPDREFLIRVSYLEVYNEQLKDLLSTEPPNAVHPIKILHDPKQGTILTGVKEQVVLNFSQVAALMKHGESQRHIGVTDMNEKSSRAHTIFKIIIESKDRNHKNGPVRVSTLNLVDLAGSESAKMTNSKGQRLQEARHINQSLLALSTIIQRLSEDHSHHPNLPNKRTQHLPFRDSKLTRLLETALDGNGKIAIVCTISPTLRCVEETANTLKFGVRAKLIQMHAKINETVDDKTLLRAYREEIEQLKQKLRELEEKAVPAHHSHSQSHHKNIEDDTKSTDSISSRSHKSHGRPSDSDSEEDEAPVYDEEDEEDPTVAAEQNAMLQMILEMERLILKADMSKSQHHELRQTAQQLSAAAVQSTPLRTSSSHSMVHSHGHHNHNPHLPSVNPLSPAIRGKNGEKRLSLTKLSTLSSKSFAAPQSKTQIVSLTKQPSTTSVPAGTTAASASVIAPKNSTITFPKSDADVKDNSAENGRSSSGSSSAVTSAPPASMPSSETEVDKMEASEVGSGPTSDMVADTERKSLLKTAMVIDTSHDNAVSEEIPLHSLDVHTNPSALVANSTAKLHGLPSLTLFSPAVVAAVHMGLRASPTSSHSESHSNGVFFGHSNGAAAVGGGMPSLNTPKLASVYSQMESTAGRLGVAPPTIPSHLHRPTPLNRSQSQYVIGSNGSCSSSNPPHPQLLLLSPARQRLQQHLQQHQHLHRHPDSLRSISNDALDVPPLNGAEPTEPVPAASVPPATEEPDTVLLNVSKMLLLLKDYIARPKSNSHHHGGSGPHHRAHRKSAGGRVSDPMGGATSDGPTERPSPSNLTPLPTPPTMGGLPNDVAVCTSNATIGSLKKSVSHERQLSDNGSNSAPPINRDSNSQNGHVNTAVDALSSAFSPAASPNRRPMSFSFASTAHSPSRNSLSFHGISTVQPVAQQFPTAGGLVTMEDLHNMRLDLKLKEADNQFLQDEIENKDKMLSLLTEGLKEVEESQRQWLHANQRLSADLSNERQINASLWMEIDRLHAVLQKHNLVEELELSPLWIANQSILASQSKDNILVEDSVCGVDQSHLFQENPGTLSIDPVLGEKEMENAGMEVTGLVSTENTESVETTNAFEEAPIPIVDRTASSSQEILLEQSNKTLDQFESY